MKNQVEVNAKRERNTEVNRLHLNMVTLHVAFNVKETLT